MAFLRRLEQTITLYYDPSCYMVLDSLDQLPCNLTMPLPRLLSRLKIFFKYILCSLTVKQMSMWCIRADFCVMKFLICVHLDNLYDLKK